MSQHINRMLIICVLAYTFSGCKKDYKLTIHDTAEIDYSFYIAGHTYGKPGVDNAGVHPPFKDKFDLVNKDEFIQFGVFTGDIVIKGTEANWNEVDADISALNKTVYFTVGNHDMTNRPLFESRYGQTYSSFIYNSDLFIILDPYIDSWNITGDQLEFLKSELINNYQNADNIFVFFHQCRPKRF